MNDTIGDGQGRQRSLVLTICSNNYLAQATTLVQSLAIHMPDSQIVLGLIDRTSPQVDYTKLSPATVIPVEDIGIPDFDAWRSRYSIVELNTSAKPSFIKYLIAHFPEVSTLVYLDPDIRIYRGILQPVDAALHDGDIAVTPHILHQIPLDGRYPQENDFVKYGLYNLGFLGLRTSSAEVTRLLDWWEERCLKLGYVRPAEGLFVDQAWFTVASILFDGIRVIREPGFNVAPWNVHERGTVEIRDDGPHLGHGSPLYFYHFSSYRHTSPKRLSTAEYNRVSLTDRPDLGPLYRDYHAALIDNGVEELREMRCALLASPSERILAPGAAVRRDPADDVAPTADEQRYLRDQIVDAALAKAKGNDIEAAVELLRQLETGLVDDGTLRRTDPLLPEISGGRVIVATADPSRQPAGDEVVITYGNYPHSYDNLIINNPVRRHVSHFWRFRHHSVEYDRRWDPVDRIFVINLDERLDRWDLMLLGLAGAGAPLDRITRVPALRPHPDEPRPLGGALACLRSHIAALRLAEQGGYQNFIILEDDFSFTSDRETHLRDLQTFFERGYDYWVCLLGYAKYGELLPVDDLIAQSYQECTNGEAYLVSAAGRDLLIPLFEDSLVRLKETGNGFAHSNDRCWTVLQPSGKFIAFRRRFGFQQASLSDISGTVIRYFD